MKIGPKEMEEKEKKEEKYLKMKVPILSKNRADRRRLVFLGSCVRMKSYWHDEQCVLNAVQCNATALI